ncbi:ty3-gypsy retrotransposon protein [Cucumis melo var. makuwa]|uniref:Ty3-gypsy retrotransposon protein n=1 Tax=Cucumis melo var. makuwa TaxID=1194695 RepID=A0A5A7VJ88_CUCMM|nr:ty3-gypsy retrotransposon protein [Cucumis melo var. makuwa]
MIPIASAQTLVEPQNVSDQLSAKAKHLRDFMKYNPKTFDGSLKDPTKAQMSLPFVETIFCLRYAKQQDFLNLEQDDMTLMQSLICYLALLLRPATDADAFCLAVDMSLHKRVDPSKAAEKGWFFQRHCQEIVIAGKTLKELPACRSCGRSHGGCYLVASAVCYKSKKSICHYSLGGRGSWYYGDRYVPNLGVINFAIELKPDTVLISRAPYKMASAKLKLQGAAVFSIQIWALRVHCNVFWLNKCSYCIYGSDEQEVEHEEHLHNVLVTLRANKLYAKFSLCEFWLKKVSFLGHVVSSKGVSVDPTKIEAVTNWLQPSTVNENLVTTLVLIVPNGSGSFVIYSDASKKEQTVVRAANSAIKTELLIEAHSSLFSMLVKAPRQRPTGLLQPLSVLEWKLTKSAHLFPGKSTYISSNCGQLYMTEIVRLHGVPVPIISDRDARFTSKL